MANKTKSGLDYFPLEVNIFSDIKCRKLLRAHGPEAITLYIYLLCRIYEDGYYIKWDEDTAFIISEILNSDEEKISLVVSKAIEIDFFNKEVFFKFRILTSRAIQKRWVKISQYIPNSFITSNINLIKEIKIPKYKLLDEKPRLYQYNVKLWYRTIKEVFKRDNYTCQYCGQIGGKLEADHIIPFSKGGSDEMSNLITSCRKCNRQKKDKSVDEFIKWRELN